MTTGHDIRWLLDDALYTVPRTIERGDTMYEFKAGDSVNVLSESAGWGNVHAGHIGVVRSMANGRIWIDVPGITTGWQCVAENLKLVSSTARSSSTCGLVSYVNQYKDSIMDMKEGAERTIVSYEKTVKKCDRALKGIHVPNSKAFDQVKEQVESIRMDYPKFMFITKPITIPYYMPNQKKTIQVFMGKYRVTCDMRDCGNTVVEPYEGDNRHRDNHPHPHVNSSYHPCWGTYGDPIRKCYKNLDVVGYVGIMLDFLSSCDTQGWYISVLQWANPSDISDICPCCSHGIDECECEREDWCNECDMHQDECECTRCPDSGDILQDNSFPDGSCARCNNLCKNIPEDEWQCTINGGEFPHFSVPLSHFVPEASNRNNYETIT